MNWNKIRTKLYGTLALGALTLTTIPHTTWGMEINATRTYQKIYLDMQQVTWKVYNVNDENYVRLADLCPPIGTELLWDSSENAVFMTSHGTEPILSQLPQDQDIQEIVARAAAYDQVIQDVKTAYGSHTEDNQYTTGLYHVSLIDLDQDGEEELLLSYLSSCTGEQFPMYTITHTTEVWAYTQGKAERIHKKDVEYIGGGNYDYNNTCTLVQTGDTWHLAYTSNHEHMYSSSKTLDIYSFLEGKEVPVESLDYSTKTSMGTTSYTLKNKNLITDQGSGSSHEGFPNNLWAETTETYEEENTMDIYTQALIHYPLQRQEGEALLQQWRINPQSKLKIHAIQTNQRIFLDGNPVTWLIYNINDENYIRLADLCPEIGVGLLWDSTDNRVLLTSDGSLPSNILPSEINT